MSESVKVGDIVTYGHDGYRYKVLCVSVFHDIAAIVRDTSTDPADAFMTSAGALQLVPEGPKLSREYTPKQLEQARAKRQGTLDRLIEEYGGCCCAYPIVSYRNRHGHDQKCPAAAIKTKWQEEGR